MAEFTFLQNELPHLEGIIVKARVDLQNAETLTESKQQSEARLYSQLLGRYLSVCKFLQKDDGGEDETSFSIPEAWRDDSVVFAREALKVNLYEHQQKFCRSERRINLLVAGRGAGKSLAACVAALHRAAASPKHIALVVSSGQRMSSDFGQKLLDLAHESALRPWITRAAAEQISFKNGSVVKLLPANADTIRGYHPKSTSQNAGVTVILDEACFMEQGDEIRKAVEYALITAAKDRGRLYIVSSPSTTGSWVYSYAQRANDPEADIALIQCSSAANPSILPEEIERLRKTKNELEFRAEVLGEWVDGAYGLFGGLIETNRMGRCGDPIPEWADCALGADLALSYSAAQDRNALAVVARWLPENSGEYEEETRYRLVEMAVLDRASDRELRQTVRRLIEKYGVRTACVETYQGKGLSEYCQSLKVETQLVNPTAGAQQSAFHELHRLLRQNLLELPDDLPPVFFDEMAAFEYRRESNGRISFGGPSGAHDDTVYALAWAIQAAEAAAALPPPIYSSPPLIAFIPKT